MPSRHRFRDLRGLAGRRRQHTSPGAHEAKTRIRLQAAELHLELAGQPEVVIIEKCDIMTVGATDSEIKRRSRAEPTVVEGSHPVAVGFEHSLGVVFRSIIHHDYLAIGIGLSQGTFDGVLEIGNQAIGSVVGGDDDAYTGHDS